MHSSFRRLPQRKRAQRSACRLEVESLEDRHLLSAPGFLQTNLVSDMPGLAAVTDPNLVNPWGLSATSTSAFWVSNNGTGTSTLYNGQGKIVPLVVTIPSNTPGMAGVPSGVVANTLGSGFDVSETANGMTNTGSSAFLFDTEDGLIAGWSPSVDQNNAIVAVNNPGASYKGLAMGTDSAGQTLLYAANFSQGTIDVFDQNFQSVTPSTPGAFQDNQLPSGYAPFNIQNINGQLYVEYALFDPTTTDGLPGAGTGSWTSSPRTANWSNVSFSKACSMLLGEWRWPPQTTGRSATTCWSAISATATSTPSILPAANSSAS